MRDLKLTMERLREVLDYDPVTGVFTWKVDNSSRARAGTRAGGGSPSGHRSIMIDKEPILAQRLAWFWTYGVWPRGIRFKDGDPSNCAIANLTETTHPDDTAKQYNLKRSFGIGVEKYREMFAAQNGVCAVCEQPEKSAVRGKKKHLAVDHCHTTGEIRGLLCSNCNLILGHAGDSQEVILKAIAYLRRHQNKTTVVPLRVVNDGT